MMAGIWVFGQLADRIGRKPSFLLFQAGAVVMVMVYSQLTDPNVMLWLVRCWACLSTACWAVTVH